MFDLSINFEGELEEALNELSIIVESNNDHPYTSKEMLELINEIKQGCKYHYQNTYLIESGQNFCILQFDCNALQSAIV